MTVSINDYSDNIEPYRNYLLVQCNHQETGVTSQCYDLENHVRLLKKYKKKGVDADAILEYITHLRVVRGNIPSTVNRKISSIKEYFRFLRLKSVEGSASVPTQELKSVRSSYTGMFQTLRPNEVKQILDLVDTESVIGFRDYAVYSLMYRLGLRVSEVHKLRLEDIDLEQNLIYVRGKGRENRTLGLENDMPELMAKLIVSRQTMYRSHKNDALFLSKRGKPLAIRTIQDNFKKIVDSAGKLSIKKVSPHTLRHAFATHMMENKDANLIVLKAIMGHKYLSTLEIYLHPSIDMPREAVNDHLANELLGGKQVNSVFFTRFQPIKKAI